MTDQKFEEQMENLQPPATVDPRHQQLLKITLMNAKRSSRAGLLFIILPCLFLMGVLIKYWLEIDLKFFSAIEDWMGRMDKVAYIKWIAPLLLVGLPLAGIVINLLAITHFYIDKKTRELVITVKYKLKNILLLAASTIIVGIFVLYAIGENLRHVQE